MRLALLTLWSVFVLAVDAGKFRVIREWKHLNFTWPTRDSLGEAIGSGAYVPANNVMTGIKHFEGHYYVTLPRMKRGVPATLARIPSGPANDTAPLLEPFPSWEMNRMGDCGALQNVQNVEIDPKGQIWIIDFGRTETLVEPVVRCPPKLVIFDIKKNTTTTAYTFPNNVASLNSSFLYDIVVDDTDSGYAYITDNSVVDPGIIVFSVKDHHSWKIRHSQSMRADPKAATFKVNSVTINTPINVAGIALGPRIHATGDRIVVDEDRQVFYSPLSSLHLFSMNTSVLRNEMNGQMDGEFQGNVRDCGIKASQTAGIIMDNKGILYYTLLGTSSIAKWDSHLPFQTSQKLIARDPKFLEWPNSFAFDQSGNITVLVNRLDRFLYSHLNITEPNFRLINAYTGSRSYLYDQGYDYTVDPNVTTSATTEGTGLAEPEILPGSDNDPYLIPQPIPEHKPETTEEPKAEPEPMAEPEPTSDLTTLKLHEPKSEHEPRSEPKAEPEPTAEPEPIAVPHSEEEYEPKAEPEHTSEPEPSSEPELSTESGSSAKPEPSAKPETFAKTEPSAKPEPSAEPKPSADPEPSAEHEPSAEPEPSAELNGDNMDQNHTSHDHMNHDHMNRTSVGETSRVEQSSASKVLATFIGIISACLVFIV